MNQPYEPSQAEIAAECARIRSTWTPAERMTAMERVPPMLRADYVGIEAAAAVKLEDRLEATMAAMKA